MRKIFLVLLFLMSLMIFPFSVLAQTEITRYLPHFVAGSLPDSEWESKILLVNLSGSPNLVTVDFFDNFGNPLVISTNKGIADSFTVLLPKPVSDSVSSDVLEIFRNTDSFITGWAKVRSTQPFFVDLEFSQFLPGGTKSVGKADVASSPVENVLTYPLSPNNGVALVNPGSQDTIVSFKAFDRSGNKLKEGKFILKRGWHVAMFFNQDPFFLDATGIIVISSYIPLSGIALNFDGVVFKTIPRIDTPRRLNSQQSTAKIGFAYIYDDKRQPQPNIQKRLAEYVEFQQALLDKEMPLNGFNRVQLPYDFDENGLPKVLIMNVGDREQFFDYTKQGLARIEYLKLENEINRYAPSDWKQIVVFVDMWKDRIVDGQRDDIVISGGGKWSWLSARHLPFLNKNYFGDKRQYRGIPIPEFGGKPMPFDGEYGLTFEDLADAVISLVNHENSHAFWLLGHSSLRLDSRFRSMVGYIATNGCMNPKGLLECILLPIEAQGVASGVISRPNDFDWIAKTISEPTIEVLSQEFVNGSKLRVTFRAEDRESGINSFSIFTTDNSPWTRYWRTISHLDNLERITLEADVSEADLNKIFLIVRNNHGRGWQIKLF